MQQRWLGLSDPAFRLQSLLWSCSADIPRVVWGHWHFSYVRKQSCEKGFIWSRVHNLSSANNLESVQDQLLALCKKTEVFLSRNWLFYSGCMSLKIVPRADSLQNTVRALLSSLALYKSGVRSVKLKYHILTRKAAVSLWRPSGATGGPAGPKWVWLISNASRLVWVWILV